MKLLVNVFILFLLFFNPIKGLSLNIIFNYIILPYLCMPAYCTAHTHMHSHQLEYATMLYQALTRDSSGNPYLVPGCLHSGASHGGQVPLSCTVP